MVSRVFNVRTGTGATPERQRSPGAELLAERDASFNADTYVGHTPRTHEYENRLVRKSVKRLTAVW